MSEIRNETPKIKGTNYKIHTVNLEQSEGISEVQALLDKTFGLLKAGDNGGVRNSLRNQVSIFKSVKEYTN